MIYCPYCNSGRVSHEVDRDHEGNPTNAWFQCDQGHQWSDFKESERLLNAPPPAAAERD